MDARRWTIGADRIMSWVEYSSKPVKVKSTKPWFPHSSVWPRPLRWFEHHIRVHWFGQRSYFIDNWTIEKSEMLDIQYGMDLELELTKAFRDELEKEMKEHGPSALEQQQNMDALEKAIKRIKKEMDEAEADNK